MGNSKPFNHFDEIKNRDMKLIEYHCPGCDLYFWLCQDEIQSYKGKRCPECGDVVSPVDDSIPITTKEE